MTNIAYPQRAPLQQLASEIFMLVSQDSTPEQWAEWLRVPLEHAAASGRLDLVNALIGAGADGSAGWRGCHGRTLFDAAARGGNGDVVSALLEVGAHPDVNVLSTSSKRSALYQATASGHQDVARRLIIAGADVHFRDPKDECDVLSMAVQCGFQDLVNLLLVGGASPNARDAWGRAPLHIAAGSGCKGIVSTLLVRGAGKDALDDNGHSPLMRGSENGHLAVVKCLLAAGADVGVRCTKDGYTALDMTAWRGYVDVLKAIVGHGADVNSEDESGLTALHVAAFSDQAGVVDALIEAKAKIELKDNDGTTALGSAASEAQCKAMLALLRHGADVGVRENDGYTPLHLACSGRSVDLELAVDLLLRWGADETALNSHQKTPADLLDSGDVERGACSQDKIERARLLLVRAPADRAWRRRCWLVMLRSRSSTERIVPCDGSTNLRECAATAASRAAREECRAMGVENAGAIDCRAGTGAEGENGGLSNLLALLVSLELEGVFRTVVRFL